MVTPLLFVNLTIETQSSLYTAAAAALKPRARERFSGSDGRETSGRVPRLGVGSENQKFRGLKFEKYSEKTLKHLITYFTEQQLFMSR